MSVFCCCCSVAVYAVLHCSVCPTLCDPMDCNPPSSSACGDSPSKNTGVSCHALLQGIFPTQGSNPGLPHCRQILYHLSRQGSPVQSLSCQLLYSYYTSIKCYWHETIHLYLASVILKERKASMLQEEKEKGRKEKEERWRKEAGREGAGKEERSEKHIYNWKVSPGRSLLMPVVLAS